MSGVTVVLVTALVVGLGRSAREGDVTELFMFMATCTFLGMVLGYTIVRWMRRTK